MPTSSGEFAKNPIPSFKLNAQYRSVHKEGEIASAFGMDVSNALLDGGFGLYSSEGVKARIGPLKSEFYRIGFCLRGSLEVNCGLETFRHQSGTIHFNFPGQIFSLQNKSEDMFSYYALFTQDFIEEILPARRIQLLYPFLDYAGTPFFQLSEDEARAVERLFLAMDKEWKERQPDASRAVKLYVDLLLLTAKRSYIRQNLAMQYHNQKSVSLVARFKKLVAQHFLTVRSVQEYASKLAVSPKHLAKVVKQETDKLPSAFIDEMLLLEIQSLLRYTDFTVAEISYRLNFSDPSHLVKFFKKHAAKTPMQYKQEIE
jgi:AraC-like DNA-binding protein